MADDDRQAVEEEREQHWIRGHRAAWLSALRHAASELGYDDPLAMSAALIAELESTRRALRDVCEDFGDNDWTDDLYLADVVEKHLHRHLDDNSEEVDSEEVELARGPTEAGPNPTRARIVVRDDQGAIIGAVEIDPPKPGETLEITLTPTLKI